jgi:hypothetical protein
MATARHVPNTHANCDDSTVWVSVIAIGCSCLTAIGSFERLPDPSKAIEEPQHLASDSVLSPNLVDKYPKISTVG